MSPLRHLMCPKCAHFGPAELLLAALAGLVAVLAGSAKTAPDQQKRPRPCRGRSAEPPIGIEPMTYSLRVGPGACP